MPTSSPPPTPPAAPPASTPPDVKVLQLKLLEILDYFDAFCKKQGLRYFLCGGCLIGAVRHKGFIPWDDDVDIFMPRPDYERLAQIWNGTADTSRYVFCRTDRSSNYHDGGASVRDVNTTEINRHSVHEDICHGIAIEIMPIDGCPRSRFARARQLFDACLFGIFNVQRPPDNKGRLVRILTNLAYRLVKDPDTRFKIWKNAERRMSRFPFDSSAEVTELIGALHGMLLRHPKSDFDHTVDLDFEGRKLPVMAGYETYLRKIWGDYMALPPPEKRVAKHDSVYTSVTEPYARFKGTLYCVKEPRP